VFLYIYEGLMMSPDLEFRDVFEFRFMPLMVLNDVYCLLTFIRIFNLSS